MSAELLNGGLAGIEACEGLRNLSPQLREMVIRKEIALQGIETSEEELQQTLSLFGSPENSESETDNAQEDSIEETETPQTPVPPQTKKQSTVFVKSEGDHTRNDHPQLIAREEEPRVSDVENHDLVDLITIPSDTHDQDVFEPSLSERFRRSEPEFTIDHLIHEQQTTLDTDDEHDSQDVKEKLTSAHAITMAPLPTAQELLSAKTPYEKVPMVKIKAMNVDSAYELIPVQEAEVSDTQATEPLATAYSEPEDEFKSPQEEKVQYHTDAIIINESLDTTPDTKASIESLEFEAEEAMPTPLMQGDIETDLVPDLIITDLTAELQDLFTSDPDTKTPIDDLNFETFRLTDVSMPELVSVREASEYLLAPFIQSYRTETSDPMPVTAEFADAVTRLMDIVDTQRLIGVEPELTEKMVEDLLLVLEQIGCQEPAKALIMYAKENDIRELFITLNEELPNLVKFIDYQQHLLAALSHALARSDRRQTIATLLRNLLFVPHQQAA